MMIGGAGFCTAQRAAAVSGAFLMGVHSTLFGPVKYAYPAAAPATSASSPAATAWSRWAPSSRSSSARSPAACWRASRRHGAAGRWPARASRSRVVGRVVSRFMPPTPAPQPDLRINWNPFSETWRNLQLARENRAVFLSLLGISWLWFFGAMFLTSFFNFAKDVLGGDEHVVTLLLALVLDRHRRRLAAVREALARQGRDRARAVRLDRHDACSPSTCDFASRASAAGRSRWASASFSRRACAHWRVMADLFLLALFGGLYTVPLYALIQSRSAAEPSRAHHRREQHPQRALHDRRRR